MGRQKEWGEWHHRAPDYRLVYCGPKQKIREEETKEHQGSKLKEISINEVNDESELEIESSNQKKKLELATRR